MFPVLCIFLILCSISSYASERMLTRSDATVQPEVRELPQSLLRRLDATAGAHRAKFDNGDRKDAAEREQHYDMLLENEQEKFLVLKKKLMGEEPVAFDLMSSKKTPLYMPKDLAQHVLSYVSPQKIDRVLPSRGLIESEDFALDSSGAIIMALQRVGRGTRIFSSPADTLLIDDLGLACPISCSPSLGVAKVQRGQEGPRICVYDFNKKKALILAPGLWRNKDENIVALQVVSDECIAAVLSGGDIRVLRITNGGTIKSYKNDMPVDFASFAVRKNQYVVTGNVSNNDIDLWDLSVGTHKTFCVFNDGSILRRLALSSNGIKIATSDQHGISVVDVASGHKKNIHKEFWKLVGFLGDDAVVVDDNNGSIRIYYCGDDTIFLCQTIAYPRSLSHKAVTVPRAGMIGLNSYGDIAMYKEFLSLAAARMQTALRKQREERDRKIAKPVVQE